MPAPEMWSALVSFARPQLEAESSWKGGKGAHGNYKVSKLVVENLPGEVGLPLS
jgi:hypothetical protein